MPVINWAFLCDYAYVDALGKAYINGTFESLNMRNLPARQPQIFIAYEVTMADGESCDLIAVVTSPSYIELARDNEIGVARPGGGKAVKTFRFYNIEFFETGEYRVEILVDGIPVYFLPLTVRI